MVNWIQAVPERRSDGPIAVVDGGATRSRVAVATVDGELLAHGRGGPTNARSVGPEQAARHLADVLASTCEAGGVDPTTVTHALVTSASIDTMQQAEHLSAAARGVLSAATVATLPDTIGCWAATDALGPAVGVISGTGSVVVVADRDRGLWQRYGGWDFILGDEGSGYAFGRAALQEAMLVGEGRSDARELHDAVLASRAARERGVTDAEGLPDAVHRPAVDKAWIASFAEVLLDLADAGDAGCRRLVRREVAVLGAAAAAGVDLLASSGLDLGGPVPVGCFGGTFHSPVVHEEFVAAVAAGTSRAFSALIPAHSALVGTFALAVGSGPGATPDVIAAAADRLDAALDRARGTESSASG